MPLRKLDDEVRLALSRAAFDCLDQLLSSLPPDDLVPVRLVSAQLRMIKLLAPPTVLKAARLAP